MNKKQLMEAFKKNKINIEESEIDKMFEYIQKNENQREEEIDDETKMVIKNLKKIWRCLQKLIFYKAKIKINLS